MTVRGTLKADSLVVARIEVDFLLNPVKVHALVTFVDTEGGQTLGYSNGESAMWSQATMRKVQELRDAMEQDFAERLFTERQHVASIGTTAGAGGLAVSGLGEHLGEGVEPPSI